MSVNDKILDAIELLANNSVQKAGYDKTIQAQILSCEDQVVGKYRCKYQDAIFYAYTNNPDIKLSKGMLVYILVPGNDMRQQKTIIGMVDKLGADYISAAVGDQAYSVIGSNVIHGGAAPYDKFYLDISYADYSFDIYNNRNNINFIGLNKNQLSTYIKGSSSIIIGMKVKTNIPLEKQKIGSYGIKFSIEFRDSNNNIGIIRDYVLDENKMIDNPYNLIYPTRQYAIFDNIDGQHFMTVQKITIFNKDFPGSEGTENIRLLSGQIELSDFELSCAVRMSQEELNGLGLSIISPRGLLFLNSTDQPKILQAQVKFKGKVVSAQNISFYWGIEDLQITPQREEYNKYLGRGWKCLNKSVIIRPQGEEPTIQWVSYGDTYEVPFSQALTQETIIKVAAVYESNVITKQVIITNQNYYAKKISIESTNGTEFYYGIGETQLKCIHPFASSSQGTIVYAWGRQNNGGELEQFSYTTDTIPVQAKNIYNFAIYKCSVYDRYEENGQLKDHLMGTASIKLINSMQSDALNLLTLENGVALYKYNEKGISPTSKTLQNPQIIKQLKFKLYDITGNEIPIFNNITGLMNPGASVKWRIPATNTLLTLPDPPQTIINNYYIIQNTSSLTYGIADRYDSRKTINQIILQVTYDGMTSSVQTNLTFTKQGQVGTNGTDYYVNIMPNVSNGNPPLFPMITKFYGEGNVCKLNYDIEIDGVDNRIISEGTAYQLLKVQFLHGGDEVPSSNYEVKWRVLKNHYYGSNPNSIDDASDFSIPDNNNSKLIYNHSLTASNSQVSANIIECQITYDDHTYYSAIPFITAYMKTEDSAFDLVDGTGFHYVMYSSEGMQPEYSSLPFEFTDGNHGTCQVLGNIRTYDSINHNWNTYQNSGDLVQDNQDQFKIQPIGFYKGECVNNSVRYQTSNGIINIPIHFYLNRYNFAHLNGWDGNSIQINEEDGYILAPQLGAGQKEDDNSFTGVLMGQVKNPMKNQSDVGLFGYVGGERSFFVNSKNGSAIFGTSGNGQIIIDPASDKAMLYSHSFWTSYNSRTGLPSSYLESNYADAGMLIDLTTPQIVFKDKNFWIQSDGSIKSNRIPQYENGQIKRDNNGQIIYQDKWGFEINSQTGAINSGYNINIDDYNFKIDANGNITFTGDLRAGRISSNKYNFFVNNSAQTGQNPKHKLLQAGWDNTNNKYNFTITADGDVTMAGDITAKSGYIGDGYYKWEIGNTNINSYIRYGKDDLTDTAKGVYIGTDGISMSAQNGQSSFKIDLNNGTTYFDGSSIELSKDTVISWENYNPKISDLISNIVNGVSPSYITGTFINGKRIESPSIYGGQFYATGDGRNSGPAYYLYDGYNQTTHTLGNKVGYISYEQGGSGTFQNPYRVKFRTVGRTVLKLQSGQDLSIETGAWEDGISASNDFTIYLMSGVKFSNIITLHPTNVEAGDSYLYYWQGGNFGTRQPNNSSAYWGGLDSTAYGMLYFKIVN